MMLPLPPLDAHAHISPTISPSDLVSLDAVIVAATRSLDEYLQVASRSDDRCVWGLGCHPGVLRSVNDFDSQTFRDLLPGAGFVSEVGIDGRAKVPLHDQQTVFAEVISALETTPRPASIHTSSGVDAALELMTGSRSGGLILHWWRGNLQQTRRAIDLGCWFSVNGAQASSSVLRSLPPERVLVETDFPHSRRRDPRAAFPGAITSIEEALGAVWGEDSWQVRSRLWSNFKALIGSTSSGSQLPSGVRKLLLAV